MPEQSNALTGAVTAAPKVFPDPEVGEKHLMQWDAFGGFRTVRYGQAMFPNGVYVEVEVKSVKRAKVTLE